MTMLLTGGTVIDPASGRKEAAEVQVDGDTITAIGTGLDRAGAEVVDCSGAMVVPGLVEAHTHIFQYVSTVGAPVEEAHMRRGVVAAADAGSVGSSTFPAFKKLVVEPSGLRVLSWLSVSALGLIDMRFGELMNPDMLQPEDAIATAKANPQVVRGFKCRLSTEVIGTRCLELLPKAVKLAEDGGLPLMVHIGETSAPLPKILEHLRPGDVVSHCYTGKEHGILDEHTKAVLPEVHAARKRGVLFDSAHGKTNLAFSTAGPAIQQGFLPDVISSDTSLRNWKGPVLDLVTSMSKLMALGASLDDVLYRTTVASSKVLGLDKEGYGSLRVGGPAHVSVLKVLEGDFTLTDGMGAKLKTHKRIEPSFALIAGKRVDPVPWRGLTAS
ncbi:MAG: amidohydrolase family protein [Chloroflexi bacterium]|nr:amidohydrolase family protein [Chloroflexota bacterium]